MTKWKKELSKRGYKQEHEFPFLPFKELDGVSLKIVDNNFVYTQVYMFGVAKTVIDRNYEVVDRDFY